MPPPCCVLFDYEQLLLLGRRVVTFRNGENTPGAADMLRNSGVEQHYIA